MHPIRELYVLLLASLRGMIVLNFIKSFSWNRFSTRFSSLPRPPLLLSAQLPDWLAGWLAGNQVGSAAWLLVVKTSFFKIYAKLLKNGCYCKWALDPSPSSMPSSIRTRSACLMPYADGAFSMPSSFAQLTWRMNGEKTRNDTKRRSRLA